MRASANQRALQAAPTNRVRAAFVIQAIHTPIQPIHRASACRWLALVCNASSSCSEPSSLRPQFRKSRS